MMPAPATDTALHDFNHDDHQTLLNIARQALRDALLTDNGTDQLTLSLNYGHRAPENLARRPKPLITPALQQTRGVCVSFYNQGQLRGQAVSIYGAEPLHREVIAVCLKAASQDARFAKLTADELDTLDIHVAVLTHPCRISSPLELQPHRQGVILQHSGQLIWRLPNEPEGAPQDADNILKQIAFSAGWQVSDWSQVDIYTFLTHNFHGPAKTP